MPKGAFIVLSLFALNQNGVTTVDGNYGILTFLVGPRGCIGNVFAKVEFKFLLAAVIGSFEFKQDEKREVVVKAGLAVKPQGRRIHFG